MSDRNLLEYLDDHLAGLVAARELTRHSLSRNAGNELSAFLDRLNQGFQKDHERIKGILARYKSQESLSKMFGAWAVEKAGRLKLNRVVLGYSDLSRVTELETLLAAIEAQVHMWAMLERCRPDDARLTAAEPSLARTEAEALRDELQGFLFKATESAFAKEPSSKA